MKSDSPFTRPELETLAADVARLSRILTKERENLPAAYLKDEGLRRAYTLYFLPSNLYKIHLPLKELLLHPKEVLSKKRLRILDIGSGPGTAILGTLDFFSRQSKRPFLEFTAADPVAENLRDAERLFKSSMEKLSVDASIRTVRADMERIGQLLEGRYDIITLSNVLNEVARTGDERVAKRASILNILLTGFLANDGSCIIIEPSLRETSREMLMVRDILLKEGFRMYSPCIMDEPCPALLNPKDWCHEDIPWEPPAVVREIDKLAGLRKDSLKFSYLVLRKDKLSLTDIYGKTSFRVVSEPLVSKGKIEFYICGDSKRRAVTRLNKDKTSANEAFEYLRRGDMVGLEGLIGEGGRLKVGKETLILLKKSFIDSGSIFS